MNATTTNLDLDNHPKSHRIAADWLAEKQPQEEIRFRDTPLGALSLRFPPATAQLVPCRRDGGYEFRPNLMFSLGFWGEDDVAGGDGVYGGFNNGQEGFSDRNCGDGRRGFPDPSRELPEISWTGWNQTPWLI